MPAFPLAAIIISAQERRIVETLRNLGAATPLGAVQLFEIGDVSERRFNRLVEAGVVREVGRGKYFLDEPSLANYREARRTRAITLIIFWIVILAVAIFLLTL
jgi:hypothetical protein